MFGPYIVVVVRNSYHCKHCVQISSLKLRALCSWFKSSARTERVGLNGSYELRIRAVWRNDAWVVWIASWRVLTAIESKNLKIFKRILSRVRIVGSRNRPRRTRSYCSSIRHNCVVQDVGAWMWDSLSTDCLCAQRWDKQGSCVALINPPLRQVSELTVCLSCLVREPCQPHLFGTPGVRL